MKSEVEIREKLFQKEFLLKKGYHTDIMHDLQIQRDVLKWVLSN